MSKDNRENSLVYYFRIYGGFKAVYKSTYSRAAVILTLIMYPYWSNEQWWEDVLGILPNLLGFTLGGYAMLMAFGNEKFQSLLSKNSEDKNKPSNFMIINTTFVHFIVLQVAAIIYALLSKAYFFVPTGILLNIIESNRDVFELFKNISYGIGFFIFVYALLSSLAATFAILSIMKIYNVFLNVGIQADNPDKKQK